MTYVACRRRTPLLAQEQCSYIHQLTGVLLLKMIRITATKLDIKESLPLYTMPEFSFTVTGAPIISERKPDGSRPSFGLSMVIICGVCLFDFQLV